MKIVVTGSQGFIGTNICNELILRNHDLICIDNFFSSIENKNLDSIKDVINCDITKKNNLDKIKIDKIDVLVHLAGQSSGPKSFSVPNLDVDLNIQGTINMIDWCILNKIPRIIFASSFVVYGNADGIVSEELSPKPQSIYALSKFYCEKLFEIYAQPKGLNWNVLRMFNVYGPGQDLKRTDQGMVSIFLDIIKTKGEIVVKGSLDRFRDFIHIKDVTKAWILCIENDEQNNQIYNLGTGQKTYVRELLNLLIKINSTKEFNIIEESNTSGDIMGCYANINKIKKDLDFDPQFSLEEGLRNFSQWADNFYKNL